MQIGASVANKSISFTLPHFWSIAVIDPSMSLSRSSLCFFSSFPPSCSPPFPSSPVLLGATGYSVMVNNDDTKNTTHKVQHSEFGVSSCSPLTSFYLTLYLFSLYIYMYIFSCYLISTKILVGVTLSVAAVVTVGGVIYFKHKKKHRFRGSIAMKPIPSIP